MAIELKNLNLNKANVNTTTEYTVQFHGDCEKYNGQVKVEYRHLRADDTDKCLVKDADGDITLSKCALFKSCCKAVHGIEVDGKELTPAQICEHCFDKAEIDGETSSLASLFMQIILDTTKEILLNNTLNEDERKN